MVVLLIILMTPPCINNLNNRVVIGQSISTMKLALLGLKLYNLDNKGYPESLQELFPDYIDTPK